MSSAFRYVPFSRPFYMAWIQDQSPLPQVTYNHHEACRTEISMSSLLPPLPPSSSSRAICVCGHTRAYKSPPLSETFPFFLSATLLGGTTREAYRDPSVNHIACVGAFKLNETLYERIVVRVPFPPTYKDTIETVL